MIKSLLLWVVGFRNKTRHLLRVALVCGKPSTISPDPGRLAFILTSHASYEISPYQPKSFTRRGPERGLGGRSLPIGAVHPLVLREGMIEMVDERKVSTPMTLADQATMMSRQPRRGETTKISKQCRRGSGSKAGMLEKRVAIQSVQTRTRASNSLMMHASWKEMVMMVPTTRQCNIAMVTMNTALPPKETMEFILRGSIKMNDIMKER
ncbi:hypothetical protein RJ55_07164 [Drechmeria coniospora]|nr:hypothetical protein RJ55_07164 [Drechmeria coniospora]